MELVVDDGAVRRPLLDAGLEGLPHVYAGRFDPLPLSPTQLRSEELVQGLFLPLPAEPQRLAGLQITHHCDEFRRFSQIDLIHAHLPQGWLSALRIPAL